MVATVAALGLVAQACSLPRLQDYQQQRTQLPQTSFLFAADGTLLKELHAEQDRVVIPGKQMPTSIRDAAVAIEDQRFYQHYGVDFRAILRAAYVDATSGRIVEGGSTITQQLVKNLYVGSEQSFGRKIDEAALALQLERQLTKDQILTKYLNTIYFGEGAYGVEAAAKAFFGRDAKDLTLAESATLAGLIAAPTDFDPFQHPALATTRRNEVLGDMLAQGMIEASAYNHALAQPMHLQHRVSQQRYPAPYFVDYVYRWFLTTTAFDKHVFGAPCPPGQPYKSECPERFGVLFNGGLRINTTLDPKLQEEADAAVRQVLPYASDPYAAMTVMDPRTGFVRAMVGGRNFFDRSSPFARVNLATGGSTGRQTGSAFKAFALVTALQNGFTPSSPLNGSFASIPLSNGKTWQPQNAEGTGAGTVSLETATIDSINIAYANLEVALGDGNAFTGAAKIVATAKLMGLQCCLRTASQRSPLLAVPSAVLGSNELNTLAMADGYATLASGGLRVAPTPIQSITDSRGRVLWRAEPDPRRVVDPRVASVADSILQKVVQYGTGVAANIGRPQIGKTGTNQNFTDAWFIGAVPQLVTAVWVGYPQGQIPMQPPRTRITVFGGTWPAQIWHTFMARAVAHMPVRPFPSPSVSYVSVAVDVTQNPYCLPNQYTLPQNIVTLQFIQGTQPTRTCRTPTSAARVTVPSVIGLSQSGAERRLAQAGFYVVVKLVGSTQPPGTVISQSPPAGTQALQTTTVTITVSKRGG